MNQTIKFGLILCLICFLAAAFLAGANLLTKDKIAYQKHLEERNALKEAMPEAINFEPVIKGRETFYYKALDINNDIIGYCFLAKGKGYSGIIEIMAGMDVKGKIAGIKIISQSETPGLGAKIAELASQTTLFEAITGKTKKQEKQKPWFEERFTNKNITELNKIETITGATISSSAVINAIKAKAEEIYKILK